MTDIVESLLPCPFCGAAARTDLLPHSGGPGWVQCSECECDQYMCDTIEEAVAKWNRRAPAQAAQEQVERARSILSSIDHSWLETFDRGPDADYGGISLGDEHKAFWSDAETLPLPFPPLQLALYSLPDEAGARLPLLQNTVYAVEGTTGQARGDLLFVDLLSSHARYNR
jgi:hypothetical protein